MKKLIAIIFIFTICVLSVTGCSNNNQKIVLKSEVKELFAEEKADEIVQLITDLLKWNDDLKTIDFSDNESINNATENLNNIINTYETLYDSINVSNDSGRKQAQTIDIFSNIKMGILLSFYTDEERGKIPGNELKEYYLNGEFDGIKLNYNKLLELCENEEKLKSEFILNEEELAEYIIPIYHNFSTLSVVPQFANNIKIPFTD